MQFSVTKSLASHLVIVYKQTNPQLGYSMIDTARLNAACHWNINEGAPWRHRDKKDFLENEMLSLSLKVG